ncbi:DUF402 domain-containing protein [Cellulomonas cellasea]|uniref:DUF402 domain-containing protein n=1 Tax=Cellulomonas cellasea TaxID=43670 RepID=A0A7W4UHV0_9CELL|nr:DUF402 domain-containing protein [Cellulomonas cellasea]MBB2923990.1 hypothetical protein [Cellulomonas cellasea]
MSVPPGAAAGVPTDAAGADDQAGATTLDDTAPSDDATPPPPVEPLAGYPDVPGAVPAGAGLAWSPGDVVLWRGSPHWAQPVRVVRDDARGLVVWLPGGSEQLVARLPDGRHVRSIPPSARDQASEAATRTRWHGAGQVRVAPTGAPWSLWFFTGEDGGWRGVYVNLELPHRRGERTTVTRDLVLDLVVHPDGTWQYKDEDELLDLEEGGAMSPALAAWVRAQGERAARLVERRGWPLDAGWESWRPPAGWDEPLPLPEGVTYGADELT